MTGSIADDGAAAELRHDMARCVLDFWLTDDREATPDDLRRRYGFTEAQAAAHAAAAIRQARRMRAGPATPVTHVAGGNGAAIPVRVRARAGGGDG